MLKSNLDLKRLSYWALLSLLGWTAVVGYSIHSTINKERDGAMDAARQTARANLFKDQAFRLWASGKGGLYTFIDERNRPVPFMNHVPDRDIETKDGHRLTLMNPASMLREMMDQYADLYGIKGRISGIVTLNPANKADPWEAKAIHAFERGEKEVMEVADIGGRPFLRLIRPMIMQPSCVKCHGHLGFKLGDVRGAVGVSVPLGEFLAAAKELEKQSILTHGVIWLVGLTAGGLFFRGQRRSILEREASVNDLALAARVFDDGSQGIAISDPAGVILRVNQAFTRITGYAPEEVVGQENYRIRSDRHDAAFYRAISRSIQNEGQWAGEVWNRHKDGHVYPVAEQITALRDEAGGVSHFIAMFEDISERKRGEEALRESEARWQFALEGAGSGVWDWNLATNALFLAPGWKAQLGYREHELANEYATWETRVHADDLPRVMAELAAYLEGRRPDYDVEFRMRAKDGEYLWIRARGKVTERSEEGKPLRMIGVHDDVTDRKRAELALENRIVALTRPLDAAESIEFAELVNLADIQNLQDLFADAFGVASLITTPEGAPITRPSNFSQLCGQLIRKNEEGTRRCEHSDSILGRYNPKGPNIHHCLSAGLCNAGASITVGGHHVANWLIGQVRDESHNEQQVIRFAHEIGADAGQFVEAFREVPTMAREQFEKVARILFVVANQISTMTYQNIQQSRFIAERKRAEADLLKSEARYREAQRTAHLGHWSYDTSNQRFLWWSEETFRLLGLDPAPGNPDYATFIARVHAEDHERVNRIVEHSISSGEPFVVIYRVPRADGGMRYLEARGEARRDEEGRVGWLNGTVMDVTERRLAEERLLTFQALAEASFDAIIMARPEDSTLTYANRAAHDMYGCDFAEREMQGRAGAGFWAPEDADMMADVIRQALAGGWSGDIRQRRKDGAIFDANATVFAIGGEEGRPSRIVAIIRDISDKKQAEAALRAANAKLENVIDFLPDATIVLDAEGRVIAWNRAMEELTGVDKASILGEGGYRHGEAFYGVPRPMLIDMVLDKTVTSDGLYSQFERQGELVYAEGYSPTAYKGRGAHCWGVALSLKDPSGRVVGAIESIRDITEAKEAEREIKQNEERLRLALTASRQGLFDLDMVSGKASFSPEYAEMLGYAPEHFELDLRLWKELLHPEDSARALAVLAECQSGDRNDFAIEFRMRTVSGDWKWVRSSGRVVDRDAAGKPRRMVGTHLDIEEGKEAEEALRVANDKLESIIDFLPDATFVVDEAGRVIAWNHAIERMSGVAKTEILGKADRSYADAFYGTRRPMLIDLILQNRYDEGANFYPAYRRDGEMLIAEGETPEVYGGKGAYIWAVALPLKDSHGHVIGAIECVRDITEGRRAEQALKQSEERLRLALEGASDGIWDWDFKTGRTYFSPRYYTMLGYQPDEFPATLESWVNLLHPDDLPGAEAAIQSYLDGDRESYAIEFRCRAKDGGWRWILGRGKVVERDGEGDPIRLAGSHSDITERKEAENRLRLTQFAVEHASDGVFWFDEAGCFSYVNEQASRMLGYTREELARMCIPDVDVHKGHADIPAMVAALHEQGSLRLETELRRKDGGAFPVEISANHISFGGREHMVAHVRDVSERKRSEDALRVEKQFSDALINSLPGVFYLFDEHARLVRWNRNFLDITGYAEDQLAGMPLMEFIAEGDRELIAEKLRETYQTGSTFAEAHLLTARGGQIPYYLTGLRMREGERDYLVGTGIDITERRRAEEALRLTQFAIDSSTVAFQWVSAEGRIVSCNPQAHLSLGLTREEFIGMRIADFNPDSPVEDWARVWADLERSGQLVFETRHRRKDGVTFPVEVNANFVEYGGKAYSFAHVLDISERKSAEERLRLTQYAIDHSSVAFEWLNLEGVVVASNIQAYESLGYTRAEYIGMHVRDFTPNVTEALWRAHVDTLRHLGHELLEAEHRRKDGSMFPVEVRAHFVRFGEKEYIFSYINDITQRKAAEAALRKSEQYLRGLLEQFPGSVFWKDRQSTFLGCNLAFARSAGLASAEEVVGKNDFDMPWADSEADASRADDKAVMERGVACLNKLESRSQSDGRVVWFNTSKVPLFDEYARVVGVLGLSHDITEQKRAEEALRALNVTLEARVQDEVAKNRDKDHLLIQQSRLAAMGEMMGNIAHQWRQPINALSLVLANIKDAYEFDQLDRRYLNDQVERGGSLINKMSTTIDDFRNFFRPDRTRQAFSLARAARDAMMIVELSYAQAKIALDLDPREDAVCHGFPNEYAQVVLNLLGNAKDAILERGIQGGRVRISIEREGRLVVADNGGGIAEDTLPKVFDPYFTTRESGTGIGLYMSRMIIENMGGKITVANADGGVRATITLPLAEASGLNRPG